MNLGLEIGCGMCYYKVYDFAKGETGMRYGWLQSMLMGMLTGLTEVLPVSAEAHSRILRKFMGVGQPPELLMLLIHLAILAALYISCQTHIVKMARAKRLSRIPKRKRNRPLDVTSMMDLSLWKTMLLPVIAVLFVTEKLESMISNPIVIAAVLFVNGLILYIPQFLPSGNKDCRSLSRVEGLLMGVGGACNAVPGMSGVGAALSLASVSGIDRKYALNMVLLMDMGIIGGRIVFNVMGILNGGLGSLSFMIFIGYLLTAVIAFLAAFAAVKILKIMAENTGYAVFAYYCWGVAMFTFVLSLMA